MATNPAVASEESGIDATWNFEAARLLTRGSQVRQLADMPPVSSLGVPSYMVRRSFNP